MQYVKIRIQELGLTVFVENDLALYHLPGIIRSLFKIQKKIGLHVNQNWN